MKKFLSFVLLGLLLCTTAYASTDHIKAPSVEFSTENGGYFIYENNIESIRREDLSDTSNKNPTYIMKNTGLRPGKYSVFITNLNYTGIKNEEGEFLEPGFNIELDAVFMAMERSVVKITALGFEMPDVHTLYQAGQPEDYEETWSCLGAWADYLGMPIKQINSYKTYENRPFTPVQFAVNENSPVWLSKYIENYSAVPYLKPVNILLDFEVVSGRVDFNIAALKSNGILKDRSHHDYNASDGRFTKDRQYKGVAGTLPKVNTDLSFQIDDRVESGDRLPVYVYNQFQPIGKRTDYWVTNLNPQNDKWSRDLCAESDMLVIRYYDPNKLDLYGPGIADSLRDPFWYFDVFHADNSDVPDESDPDAAHKFVPNREVSRYEDNLLKACNLGNYGVKVHYNITIHNKSAQTRYANYYLKTGSNNIVIQYDENGVPVYPYAICKGVTPDGTEDAVASVELLPNQKTTFQLDIILPANNNGGMGNSIEISDQPAPITFSEDGYETARNGVRTNGKQFIKWHGGDLYVSDDLWGWEKQALPEKTREIFKNDGDCFELIATDDGYVARWDAYDGAPSYFGQVLHFYNQIYFFDKDFNLVRTQQFDQFPTQMAYTDGTYYVKAGENYYSKDGVTWQPLNTVSLPVQSGPLLAAPTKYGNFFLSDDEMPFLKIDYVETIPKYIGALGDWFYYTDGPMLYLSQNAVNWEAFDTGADIKTVDRILDEVLINSQTRIPLPTEPAAPVIRLNNEILVPKFKPVQKDGIWLLPTGRLFEKTDVGVSWTDANTAVASRLYQTITLTMGSTDAVVNGTPVAMQAPAQLIDGELYLPMDFVCEQFGFSGTVHKNGMVLDLRTY